MWLEECDSFAELCRGYLPYYLLIVLPIFIIISPVNPVAASHEFPVYRMHQYDLHGVPHGKKLIMSVMISLKIVRFSKKKNWFPYKVAEAHLFLWRRDRWLDGALPGIALLRRLWMSHRLSSSPLRAKLVRWWLFYLKKWMSLRLRKERWVIELIQLYKIEYYKI